MKLKTLIWMCVCMLTVVAAVNVFASQSDKIPGVPTQQATTDGPAAAPVAQAVEGAPPMKSNGSVAPLPQIKWNMSTEQISLKVDMMIAAVKLRTPIGRVKQKAFIRALSTVRDTVVKNNMADYQRAVTVLAGVSSTLSVNERSKLDVALRQTTPPGSSSSCEVTCFFGSCKATCTAGIGGGAACGCAWGFPVCGCGGGGLAT